MYTTTTTTLNQALVAAAAACRAIERHTCCKSQFKFLCFSCGEMINRGDSITRCVRRPTGMTLRYRGAGGECGLTMDQCAFYQGETGKNMWVHTGCNPCYWDEGFDNGDEYSPPALRTIPTIWGSKISCEFDEWISGPGGCAWKGDHESYFHAVKGYPKEKFMKDRIVHAITRFQAIWRGYLYKKAYPEALLQQQKDLAAQNARKRNQFINQNSIGAHIEILMDERRTSAAIYSAEVIKIQGMPEIDGLYYRVKFHHDDEVRKYHWKRLLGLKLECETFKSKHGIRTPIVGKLPIYPYYPHNSY